MALAPGTRLGNYEITAPLGAGGMGEVYRARDVRLDRAVAIKALPESFAKDPERAARFEREAKTLASLSHANIAVIYGIEDVSGDSYLVLELIEGETLAQRLARGPLDVAETLRVAAQIAAAIDAAHERGVVHRDLKPSNVMLTAAGAVKVLDFGLAKGGPAVADASSLGGGTGATMTFAAAPTAEGVILGTAPYMSPEQARGKPVDRRTDVWALGCIVFECLTGKQVFPGETASDVLARILEREPEWATLPAATPARLRDLLRRCLTKDASERPRDAGDLRGELLAILADASAPAGAAGRAGDSSALPSIAVLYFENLSGSAESDYFCAGITEDILTDLSKVKAMRVASRNAVARYRGASVEIAQIARELGVGHVLEGSVRRAGDRVRITAQLVSADGFHLWAERYDRTLEDVFAVQEEIAKAITGALSVALTPAEAKRIGQDRPADVRAYDLYLKGRAEYARYTGESLRAAIRWFEEAIAVEPGYALAHAGIADALGQTFQWGFSADPDVLRRGLDAARRAIALDPGLAEAHKAEALVLSQMGDEPGSHASLRRALQANPRYQPALGNLGVQHYIQGNIAGAERAFRRALEVEPDSAFTMAWLAYVLKQTGRFAQAEAIHDQMDARPRDPSAISYAFAGRAWMRFLTRDRAGMVAAVERGRDQGADPGNLAAYEALVAASLGQREEARRHLDAALATPNLHAGGVSAAAQTALELGETEVAVELLRRRLTIRLAPMIVRLEPSLHGLLDHSAFAPRRSSLTLTWPVEAPMIDPVRLGLFKEVKIASGTPGGSSVLEED
jgi:TolB-like protein/Flp pilus assembly protein TadD